MNFKMCAVFQLVIFLASAAGAAENKSPDYPYPSIQETYGDCKSALEISRDSLPGFLRTPCASMIRGTIYGYRLATLYVRPSVIQDPQHDSKTALAESMDKRICIPELENQPPELLVAQKIVDNIEVVLAENNQKFPKKFFPPAYLSIVTTTAFACKKEK